MSGVLARPPALVAAARHGLGQLRAPVRLDHEQAMVVVTLARHDHITGFLEAAVIAGEVLVDDEVAAAISASWRQELLACAVLEALAVRTAATLDSAEIRWRLTKGAALAHLDYPDVSLRTFGDVDIIVHPDDWLASLQVLKTAGLCRAAGELGAGYDRRYGKGATLTTTDGLEVDLHRRLAIGRFGVTSHTEDLFQSSAFITLAGRQVPVLVPELRLLHACFHATLGGFRRLRAFRDVAQLVLYSDVDWRSTFDHARRWRSEPVVAAALVDTWRVLDLDPSHPSVTAAQTTETSRGDRRALAVFGEERPFRSQALTALPRLPFYEVPRYLWSLTAPRLALGGTMFRSADE